MPCFETSANTMGWTARAGGLGPAAVLDAPDLVSRLGVEDVSMAVVPDKPVSWEDDEEDDEDFVDDDEDLDLGDEDDEDLFEDDEDEDLDDEEELLEDE